MDAPALAAMIRCVVLNRFVVVPCVGANDGLCHTGRDCSGDDAAASGRLKVKALGASRGISAAGTPAFEAASIAIPRTIPFMFALP
jgi:hypothetical protein